MKRLYLLWLFFVSTCFSYGQNLEYIKSSDTVYFYFKEDNKFMVKNDKLLPTKKMREDKIIIYEYNLIGNGRIYSGTPSFINKNFNSDSLPIERPKKLSRRKFRSIKNLITIKDIKDQGFDRIFSEAIYDKKAIFLIEKMKNGKLTILEVEYYGVYPSNE